jgi:hypothetical protein
VVPGSHILGELNCKRKDYPRNSIMFIGETGKKKKIGQWNYLLIPQVVLLLNKSIVISVESPEGEISEVSSPDLENTSDSRDLVYVLILPILFLGLGIGLK